MGLNRRVALRGLAVLLAVVLVSSCGSPSGEESENDQTAPGFLDLRVAYERVSDGLETGSDVVPATGLTRTNVPTDRRIVVAASVGDSESGVQRIRLKNPESSWTCSNPDSDLAELKQGTLNSRSDEEREGTAAAGTPSLRNAHFTIDVFDGNPLRLVCAAADDTSAVQVEFRVVATNGNGLEVESGPISISYLPRAGTP